MFGGYLLLFAEGKLCELHTTSICQDVLPWWEGKIEDDFFNTKFFFDKWILVASLNKIGKHLIHHRPKPCAHETFFDRSEHGLSLSILEHFGRRPNHQCKQLIENVLLLGLLQQLLLVIDILASQHLVQLSPDLKG